jgi:hypothetical protein
LAEAEQKENKNMEKLISACLVERLRQCGTQMSFLGNILDDNKLLISNKFYENFQNDKFDDPH